jgi:hypothetical protein
MGFLEAQKGIVFMEEAVIFNLDEDPVRFTPDGKVSILDAIQALGEPEKPHYVWKSLKAEHPEVLAYCEEYDFEEGASLPVTGSDGWDKILTLLPYYLLYSAAF